MVHRHSLAAGRLPGFGSDHFAILTELVLDPARGSSQKGLEAGPEDEAEAASVAAEEGVSERDVPAPWCRASRRRR